MVEPYRGGGRLKPHNRKLSHKERNFISYCEKFYFLNKEGFPTPEQAAVALRYSVSEINVFLQNLQVQKALERRGLPWQNAGARTGELSPTQIAAATLICNFADSRSEEEKLTALGVLPATYYAWLNDPVYQEYVSNLANRNLENVRPSALTNFAKMVREGRDLKALQYYFEVTGEFNSAQVQNLQAMLQMVVEVIQIEVKDPVVLARIAQRLMKVIPGLSGSVSVNAESFEETGSLIEETGRQNVLSRGST